MVVPPGKSCSFDDLTEIASLPDGSAPSQRDGIPSDSAPHGVRDFSLTGGHRWLLHRPRDLNWRLLCYSDPGEPLAHSTLDWLSGIPPPVVQPISPGVVLHLPHSIAQKDPT